MEVIVTIFWGVLLLCFLVFIHELGHFLAARAEGVRVSEFFLGMPCRFRLAWKSKRLGTEYGVTPLLIGGYNKICGMAGDVDDVAESVFAYVERHGIVVVSEMAKELGITEDAAYDALSALTDWGSVEPYYVKEDGEYEGQKEWPRRFRSVARDADGRTELDRKFDKASAVAAGEPDMDVDSCELLEKDRSHTYQGRGFWRRLAILLAGPLVNIVFGMAICVVAVMIEGIQAPVMDSTEIAAVQPGSIADNAGLLEGDEIVRIGDMDVDDWDGVDVATEKVRNTGESFPVVVLRDGKRVELEFSPLGTDELMGVQVISVGEPQKFPQALTYSILYVGQVAKSVAGLLIPTEVAHTVENSSSVIGITVVAGEAAAEGPLRYLSIMAMVSISLGLANLLPIPPLDGGKIVIEAIQALRKKSFKKRTLEVADMVGVAAFLVLFVVIMGQDIMRYFF